MNTQSIKKEFHELIDKIDNRLLLERFYNALSYSHNNSKYELWESLTESQKQEIYSAFDESRDEENLVSYEDVKSKHKLWLSK